MGCFFIRLRTIGHACGLAVMQENSSVKVSHFEGFGVVQDNALCLARNAHRCVSVVSISPQCNICAVGGILAL